MSAILLSYLLVEVVYILRLPLVMDEFQGAAVLFRISQEVPYRDFVPYKTVLGYYLQLPALLLARTSGLGLWGGLLVVKLWMACLTGMTLAWASFRLRRMFTPGAVVIALALLVSTSTFLERSAALRVETMTSLAGLVSLVLLLERRVLAAGVFAGLSFLISQKGGLFGIAGVAALSASMMLPDALRRARGRRVVVFSVGLVATVLVYYGVWFALSSGFDPLAATVSPVRVVLHGGYALKFRFWSQTLLRNPAFYVLAAIALTQMVTRGYGAGLSRRLELSSYAVVVIGVCLWYPQPWPYFFVLLLPTLWVLIIALFHDLAGDGRSPMSGFRPIALTGVLLLGVCYPLATRVPANLGRDSTYQRNVLELADRLVGPGESYLAGVDLLYDRRQAPPGLTWLDATRRRELARLSGSALEQVREQLAATPLRVVVDSYRLRDLPAPLREYLEETFWPLYGELAVYAPTIVPGLHSVDLRFSEWYRLEAQEECFVDGASVTPGGRVLLRSGRHVLECPVISRLRLDPGGSVPPQAISMTLFLDPYTY